MARVAGVDRGTIVRGVLIQVLVTLPPVLVIRALVAGDDGSALPIVAVAVALVVAPAAAAAYVAGRRPDAAVVHAVVTTALGWLVLSSVAVVRLALRSASVLDAVTVMPLLGLVEVGVGLCTASVVARLPRRRPPLR